MLDSFSIIFISILLEALPFVILGTFISSLIEVFISPDWIEKRFKNKSIKSYLIAGLIGVIFPVCECAIVPIMRRLVKKGMPLSLGITFMLATPIVNPVVILSTYYAFNGNLKMYAGRAVFGYIAALIVGFIISRLDGKLADILKKTEPIASCGCGHEHCHDHGDDYSHEHEKLSIRNVVANVVAHTGMEIIDVGKFLIFGALITASMQTFIPRSIFTHVSDNTFASILIMMLMAFVLSLCSEADAFIAASFSSQFPPVALMAFMVFGPMIDIKNTMMLASAFRKSFVAKLIVIITMVVLALMMIAVLAGML